jgi:acetyl esterase/lipase
LLLAATLPARAQGVTARYVDALPATKPNLVEAYGPDKLQFGELRLPEGEGPFPVAIIIHGGCWTKGYATLRNTASVASVLAVKGIATWNIEYRQVGDEGGGWPGTFLDWGAATDHLRILAVSHPLDLSRVVTIGHSAGAHASLWLAARPRLAEGSEIRGHDPLPVSAAVAIDGPGDLIGFVGEDVRVCGEPVVVPFMGGDPAAEPRRYEEASPFALLPIGVPQYLVAAKALSEDEANAYRDQAAAGGDEVEVLSVPDAGHFDVIAPGTEAWDQVGTLILKEAFGAHQRREPHVEEGAAPQSQTVEPVPQR